MYLREWGWKPEKAEMSRKTEKSRSKNRKIKKRRGFGCAVLQYMAGKPL